MAANHLQISECICVNLISALIISGPLEPLCARDNGGSRHTSPGVSGLLRLTKISIVIITNIVFLGMVRYDLWFIFIMYIHFRMNVIQNYLKHKDIHINGCLWSSESFHSESVTSWNSLCVHFITRSTPPPLQKK